MQDLLTMLDNLRRPRLLVRAARLGADSYRRNPHLKRILRTEHLPRTGPALIRLMALEAELEDLRQSQSNAYSITRHIDLLIAMMGEARLLRQIGPTDLPRN